ncbi:MAG: hypothetical protein LUD72_00370 [Bacteroidales bacterium]|nr:hypothetical protein [Bacteroidales bacterium]
MMRPRQRVFGFAGRKSAGKTMMADMLAKLMGAKRLSVATALKVLCTKLLGGITLEELNIEKDRNTKANLIPTTQWYELISKETDIPFDDIKKTMDGQFFVTIRQLLQFLGTDVIRAYNPGWHIEQTVRTIKLTPCTDYVLDDIRYPNEKRAIEGSFFGGVFFVVRPYNFDVSNHISERSLGWRDFFDNRIILNYREKTDLRHTMLHINAYDMTDDDMTAMVCRQKYNTLSEWPRFVESIYEEKDTIEKHMKDCKNFLLLEDLKLFMGIDIEKLK